MVKLKFVFAVLVLAATMGSINTHAADTDVWINTGETKCFAVTSEQIVTLHYAPQEQGTRHIKLWHQTTIAWNKFAGVSFYWKDTAGSNDWNWWRNSAVSYIALPKLEEDLYSGSSTIEYKFDIKAIQTPVLFVCATIE